MRRYHDAQGNSTRWLNVPFKEKELKRLTVKELVIIASRQRGIKSVLVKFLNEKKY